MREQLGLNQPFHIQLLHWYANLAAGRSRAPRFLLGRDVLEVTIERLPVSISIALYALVMTLLFGIVAGVLAALRQNTWLDQLVMTIALIGVSLPNFWLGLMLIVLFAVQLGWLPSGGYVDFRDDLVGWLQAADPARDLARDAADGPARAHHPLDHAGGAAPGLHPHGARQGPARAPGGRPARAQERDDPGGHRDRHHLQPAAVGLGRDRDDLLDPGRRLAARLGDPRGATTR